ncbi:MAG: hypothetical protein U0W40_09770 [Acidimicrobiia bacterium]
MTDEMPASEPTPASEPAPPAAPPAETPAPPAPAASELPPPPPTGAAPPPPPGYAPAPAARGKVAWPTRTKAVVVAGAVLTIVGSVLPWAKQEIHFLGQSASKTTNGLDGDGKITIVLAIVALLVFFLVPRAKVVGGLVLAAGILVGLTAIADIVDVGNNADDLKKISSNADATVGIGLWLVAIAAVVLIVGGVFCLMQKDRAAPAAPPTA